MTTTTTDTARRRSILRWLDRRLRGVETLPPVRVNLTAHTRGAADAMRAAGVHTPNLHSTAAGIRTADVVPPAETTSEPPRPRTDHLCDQLDAVTAPRTTEVWRGTYRVTLSRLRGATDRPDPLAKVKVEGVDDLASAIARHAEEHLGDGRPVEVTVDPAVRGGILRAGGRTIGTFSYAPTTAAPARDGR